MSDTPRLLRLIELYYNSQFESGPEDGARRKFFYNIVKPACDVATKFIDLDTKHILPFSEKMEDEFRVWILARDLKAWMKEKRFGKLLNRIASALPKYGHVVVKHAGKNELELVNLLNLRFDPAAKNLSSSPCVVEIHLMDRRQIAAMKWEGAEDFLAAHDRETHFEIFECYSMNTATDGKMWSRHFMADLFTKRSASGGQIRTTEAEINEKNGEFLPGVMLHEDETDELPYFECKWEDVPGRLLGMGFVEYLIDNQIRQNELTNNKAKGLEIASKHLFQTSDEMIGRNVFTDMDNGDIIKTTAPIAPVPVEERSLSSYQEEQARWDLNTERKTFSFDITRGEELPSGTPLGVAKLSQGAVESYYAIKREEFGFFVKELLLHAVIPQFMKDRSKEHALRFFGSDEEIGRLRKALSVSAMRRSILDYAKKTGIIPSQELIQMQKILVERKLEKKKDLELKIPEAFYEDVEFGIDLTITGEEIDTAGRQQTLMTAMQMLASNPAILQDPNLRRIFSKLLELSGVSGVDLGFYDDVPTGSMMPGGAPLPKTPPLPVQPAVSQAEAPV